MDGLKVINVALMGMENGHTFGMFRHMKKCEYIKIVAVSISAGMRTDEVEKCCQTNFAEEGIDVYYDEEEMLNAHPEIQGCAIGGSNRKHMRQFRLCAERKIDIISMKVPTLDMDEYDEMLRLKEKYGIVVFTELEMRWKADVERVKELIKSGAIGEVESFTAYNYSHNPMWWRHWMDIPEESYGKRIPIRPNSHRFRGGALTDHPHIFDLITYILESDIDMVYAEAAPNLRPIAETEDMTYVTGTLKNGVIFSLDPSYASKEREASKVTQDMDFVGYPKPVQVDIEIHGTKGSIITDAYCAENVEAMELGMKYHVTDHALKLPGDSRKFVYDFVKSVNDRKKYQPQVSFENHKKTMMAVNAAYDSIYTGKVVKIKY